MALNVLSVNFAGLRRRVTSERWKIDYGQKIEFLDIELPEYFECHFANTGDAKAKQQLGHNNVVVIPDEYIQDGRDIDCYIYLHEGTEDGETVYKLTVRVRDRPELDPAPITPVQEDIISRTIAALEDALERSEAQVEEATRQAGISEGHALDSEAWAVGERGGEPVEDTDETYQNNAKYYAGEADRISRANATLAQSWAVGGTGTRPGEDNDNAKHYSDLAAQGAEESGYAWFDVDDSDGHMYIYISDNLSEDVSFAVNESTGHLAITYN